MIDVNKPVTNPDLAWAIQRVCEEHTPHAQYQMFQEVMRAHFLCPAKISPPLGSPDEAGAITLKEDTTIEFPLLRKIGTQEQYHMAFTGWVEYGKWQKNETEQDMTLSPMPASSVQAESIPSKEEAKSEFPLFKRLGYREEYFRAFTGWAAPGRWQGNENQQAMILTFDDYAALVLKENSMASGFVINPNGENIPFDKDLIRYMLRHKEADAKPVFAEKVVEKNTTIKLGEPLFYPTELVQAISDCLRKHKNVKAAYFQIKEEEGEFSYLLVLDIRGEKGELFQNIGDAAAKYLDGMYLDMMLCDKGLGREVARKTKPVYRKKRFGIF